MSDHRDHAVAVHERLRGAQRGAVLTAVVGEDEAHLPAADTAAVVELLRREAGRELHRSPARLGEGAGHADVHRLAGRAAGRRAGGGDGHDERANAHHGPLMWATRPGYARREDADA